MGPRCLLAPGDSPEEYSLCSPRCGSPLPPLRRRLPLAGGDAVVVVGTSSISLVDCRPRLGPSSGEGSLEFLSRGWLFSESPECLEELVTIEVIVVCL